MVRRRAVSAGVAVAMIAGLFSAVLPVAAADDPCAQETVAASALPAQVTLDECDISGATITARGMRADVPPPGQGRTVVGLTTAGEVALEVATSADGVVAIETATHATALEAAEYTAAQASPYVAGGDAFADAAPLPVPDSFMPSTGQSFELGSATVEAGEPDPGCDPTAVGSLWYRIERPGTLRRIKLRSDTPLALYRGSDLGALRRVACIPANAHERRLTIPRTGVHYIQVAVTEADLAIGKFAAHAWLANGEMRPDGTPPCDSRAFTLVDDMAARKPLRWRFHAAATPPSITKRAALRSIKRGISVITRSKNDCGLADTVSARHRYLGKTRKKASMCIGRGPDGVNSMSFGPAEQIGMLGLACSAWTISATGKKHVFESDIRFTSTVAWTARPDAPSCRQNVDVDLMGVAAHEAGHVFGLDHAQGIKGLNQTMSPSASACNGAARTLGRGDVVALRKRY